MVNGIKSGDENITVQEDDLYYEIAEAALDTAGVFAISGQITKENLLLNKGKNIMKKGIKLAKEKDKLKVDVFLILEYGFKIPQIAWSVQRNINKVFEKMSIPAGAINIHINGVHF